MRSRHRIPSIVNMSMVDVLCCALGCVIMLWLLNLRVARGVTLQASETGQTLDATKSDLEKDLDAREKSLAETLAKLKEQEKATAAAKELVEKRDKTLLTSEQLLKDREETLDKTREKLARAQKDGEEREKVL